MVSSKLFEGETAIVALVEEDEPAFDAVFAAYKTTAIRYDAEDVAKEAEELRRLEEQVSEDVANEIKAQRKAEREEKAKKDFEEYEESVNRTMTQASPI